MTPSMATTIRLVAEALMAAADKMESAPAQTDAAHFTPKTYPFGRKAFHRHRKSGLLVATQIGKRWYATAEAVKAVLGSNPPRAKQSDIGTTQPPSARELLIAGGVHLRGNRAKL